MMVKASKASSGNGGKRGGAPSRNATPKKPPMTDAERHKRFKDMAREVEASDSPEDFDAAFKSVTRPPDG